MSANQKSLRELIERRPPRLSKEEEERLVIHTGQKMPRKKGQWRQLGASTIKFEFVLTLTKNIVPLIMILVMGEVRRTTLRAALVQQFCFSKCSPLWLFRCESVLTC